MSGRPISWYLHQLAALGALSGFLYLMLEVMALVAPGRVPH